MHDVTDGAHQDAARKLRAILATYAQAEDLIRIGAYVRGNMPALEFSHGNVDAKNPDREFR